MTFCIELKGYALLMDCDTWEQAEKACDCMGADLQGELIESEEWDYPASRVLQ